MLYDYVYNFRLRGAKAGPRSFFRYFFFMLRVFLGIDLNPELKFKIEKVKSKNKLIDLPIKLVEAENSHIALKFLDELKDWQIDQVIEKMTLVLKGVKGFFVAIDKCLIFPNFGNPRVLALQVESQTLVDLGQKIFHLFFHHAKQLCHLLVNQHL